MSRNPFNQEWYRRRWEILQRDKFTCRYCGQFAPNVMLEVDHVIPVCEGGDDSDENLVTACRACNWGKEAYRAFIAPPLPRKARAAAAAKSAYIPAVDRIQEWLSDRGAPVDKYVIVQETGFSLRAVELALANLRERGLIVEAGKVGRRQLWRLMGP